ncbi:MAG: hypothetical protein M1834_007973 [Cirrosporium novae-zelandiae]|nr:MAG: hypothetical protein M1834_007973 [Cirrosporium novae-zelandiae]
MVETRRSARQAAAGNGARSPPKAQTSASSSKRKSTASTNSPKKQQKTIEETLTKDNTNLEENVKLKIDDSQPANTTGKASQKEPVKDSKEETGHANNGVTSEDVEMTKGDVEPEKESNQQSVNQAEVSADDGTTALQNEGETNEYSMNGNQMKGSSTMDKAKEVEPLETKSTAGKEEEGSNKRSKKAMAETKKPKEGAVIASGREEVVPSNILEKGIIYFFFRGRVGIDEPQEVSDIARSYIVLRPLPHGAKLGDGPISDTGNNRFIALPKKVLPLSHRDRFMLFVEKAKTSLQEIKENHLAGSDYETKTAGTRHTPPATPIAEGIYAITTTGRGSHLAYILTVPSNGLGEVQKDMGLRERGSFVTSVKNPQYPGPTNAALPQGPDYPKELLDEFKSLRWIPLQPKFLDYPNTQFLIIGEGLEDISKTTEPQPKDKKHDKETPLEEMEKLEDEDQIRVEHLKGDDSVFDDLSLSSKEYPKVPTTW